MVCINFAAFLSPKPIRAVRAAVIQVEPAFMESVCLMATSFTF
jgi:hypothetical protein